jgi:glycosyltransferase involved in cell wall biosynthesis
MLAGRWTGIGRLVYTRHHTLHNHKYHPVRGVLYDRIINTLAHWIIAVAQNVVDVLVTMEKVPPGKVALIHHGFDLRTAREPDPIRTAHLRRKYGFVEGGPWPVIGVISRPFEWKGLDHVIPAFANLLGDFPNARLMLFHWTGGAHSERYERMLEPLPRRSWRTVRWESFVDDLFPMFDVFVHVPEDRLSEAFGFVYVETLTTGTPSVLTNSGILYELDPSRLEGITVVPFKDPAAIEAAMRKWLGEGVSPQRRLAMARVNTAYLNTVISSERKMERLYEFYARA